MAFLLQTPDGATEGTSAAYRRAQARHDGTNTPLTPLLCPAARSPARPPARLSVQCKLCCCAAAAARGSTPSTHRASPRCCCQWPTAPCSRSRCACWRRAACPTSSWCVRRSPGGLLHPMSLTDGLMMTGLAARDTRCPGCGEVQEEWGSPDAGGLLALQLQQTLASSFLLCCHLCRLP